MKAEDKLIKGGFIDNSLAYVKYLRHLDKIFDAIIDYGYVDRIIPEHIDNPYVGRKDTEEYCAFRVRTQDKEEFENIMKDLNIYLTKEMLKKDGEEKEFYMFKSRNLPELRSIVRGSVKIKEQEAMIAHAITSKQYQ